jgi:hypothetical protein
MAKNNVLFGAFVSFLVILVLIAVVKAVFPNVLVDGFSDMACYGVVCEEGQFCQNKVCRDINPPYTNNYYNEGVESFKDAKKQ